MQLDGPGGAHCVDLEVDDARRLPSPTAIAESEPGEPAEDHEMKTRLEKRKRTDVGAAVPIPGDDEDDELDSPTKRAQVGDEKPLTSKELRELLFGHVTEMKTAWREFQGRLGRVEQEQNRTEFEVKNLQSRTRVLEKDLVGCRQLSDQTSKSLEALTEEVKNMKVQLSDTRPAAPQGQQRGDGGATVPGSSSDPWGEYLRRRQGNGTVDNGVNLKAEQVDKGDNLTDDEKRTLVIGGWLQDTKRSVIEEEEAASFLAHADIKPLIDADRLAIYGPRRSVGMLKFTIRDGETFSGMRNRMWDVIRALGRHKFQLPSTKTGEDHRVIWASFVKPKSARQRSTLVSMIRRVTIALAVDANAAGENSTGHTNTADFDCDWNMGTIWCESLKLGSATHRAPKEEEQIQMPGGWVSLSAGARTANCSTDEAKTAFERELNQ